MLTDWIQALPLIAASLRGLPVKDVGVDATVAECPQDSGHRRASN